MAKREIMIRIPVAEVAYDPDRPAMTDEELATACAAIYAAVSDGIHALQMASVLTALASVFSYAMAEGAYMQAPDQEGGFALIAKSVDSFNRLIEQAAREHYVAMALRGEAIRTRAATDTNPGYDA